jgi:regulatory protein
MTEARLRRIIGYYLERYVTTTTHLKRLMRRKIAKACAHHGDDPAEAHAWLDAEVERLVSVGVLNDLAYARDRARTLVRRGNGPAKVRAKLAAKGLPAELIDDALASAAEELGDPTWRAALVFARKRRLGPFGPPVDRDGRRKQLAKLGRGGFPYDVAQRVLELDEQGAEEALDALQA